jgi:hypothetical protein
MKLKWRRNPDLDKKMTFANFSFEKFVPEYWDIGYEQVWYLDPRVCPGIDEKIWAFTCHPEGVRTKGVKEMGNIMPDIQIDYNPEIPRFRLPIDEMYPPFWDLERTTAYGLDEKWAEGSDEKIWVVKFSPNWNSKLTKPQEWKWIADIEPSFVTETNPALPEFKFKLNYHIPLEDLDKVHVWHLKEKLEGERVWAVKIKPSTYHEDEKDAGIITPILPEHLDVIFISYNEPNAEKNWTRLLEKAPWAKRIHGKEGIFDAHKFASELATTDMFYVVDGDAYIIDEFEFNFQPALYDRMNTFVWASRNPINDLEYGYGGVKLFPKKAFSKKRTITPIDVTTSVTENFDYANAVSNETLFNTDPWSTWKSAFRECVKLSSKLIDKQIDFETEQRLEAWTTLGEERPFGKYSIIGAKEGVAYGIKHKDNLKALAKINDFDWLRNYFKKTMYERFKEHVISY